MMIAEIAEKGDQSLNKFLESEVDREVLYHKFPAYRTFAAAYDCPLDLEGAVGGHREQRITHDKWIVFHGVNTSLLWSKYKEEEGKLLLGQRQRVNIMDGSNFESGRFEPHVKVAIAIRRIGDEFEIVTPPKGSVILATNFISYLKMVS